MFLKHEPVIAASYPPKRMDFFLATQRLRFLVLIYSYLGATSLPLHCPGVALVGVATWL